MAGAGGRAGATNAGDGNGVGGNQTPAGGMADHSAGTGGDAGMGNAGGDRDGGGYSGASAESGGAAGKSGIVVAIHPEGLPAPCSGSSYSTTLGLTGGTAPFEWRLTPAVDQWHIEANQPDTNQARLTGVTTGNVSITIQVTDATGASATKSYSVTPRTACWFAYTTLESTGPSLSIVDPLLSEPPPVTLANNQGVYDFQFSPSGQFLVYRYGVDATHASGAHLALLDMATWEERRLPFSEDAVTTYSWSSDSRVLAAAFIANEITYLGGVRFDASGSVPPTTLKPISAPVDSSLYWLGLGTVAFHSALMADATHAGQFVPTPEMIRLGYAAALGADGFQNLAQLAGFNDPPLFLQPTDDGIFITSELDEDSVFDWSAGGVSHNADHQGNVISPSGAYTAGLVGTQLQVFRARDDDNGPPFATSQLADECPRLLTWAKNRERIACVADVSDTKSTHGEVRIFDLKPESPPSLVSSTLGGYCVKTAGVMQQTDVCSALQYDYTEDSAFKQPRVFSASGNWLAFVTDSPSSHNEYLYLGTLTTSPIRLWRKDFVSITPTDSVSPVQLAFSPDEHYLLQQRGTLLSVHDVTAPSSTGVGSLPVVLFTPAQQASACSEDFPSAPDSWCGTADRAAPFVWAPSSRIAAYRTQGGLTIVDISQFPLIDSHGFNAADCNHECLGQFMFQPQPF